MNPTPEELREWKGDANTFPPLELSIERTKRLIQYVEELQLDAIGDDDDRDGMVCQLEERAEAAERRANELEAELGAVKEDRATAVSIWKSN